MENKNRDLYLTIALSLLAILFTFSNVKLGAFSLLYGLPLVFFLPGYTVTELFFPRNFLDSMERLLFRIGMSICIAIFAGFLLNITSTGLQPSSWAVFLGSFTLIIAFVAIVKRRAKPETILPSIPLKIRPVALFLLACSALITIGAYVFERSTTGSLSHIFTQFWMIPANNGHQLGIEIGINNMENDQITYHVVVQSDQRVLQDWPSITLSPGQTWHGMLDLAQIPPQAGPVKALLYRQDSPSQIYRSATWWPAVNVPGVSGNPVGSVLR